MTRDGSRSRGRRGLKQRRAVSGFTLLEAVLALAVVTAAATLLIGGLRDGWRSAGIAGDETHALQIAKGELAKAGVEWPLSEGRREREHPGGYRSTVEAVARGGQTQSQSIFATATGPETYLVSVRVAWRDANGIANRTLRLDTIKIATFQDSAAAGGRR